MSNAAAFDQSLARFGMVRHHEGDIVNRMDKVQRTLLDNPDGIAETRSQQSVWLSIRNRIRFFTGCIRHNHLLDTQDRYRVPS